MAERSALNQVVQIGVESTHGTSVAASKRLQSIGFEPSPKVEMDQFRPAGTKYKALATLGKEWTEAAVAGRGSYTEMVYLWSSVLSAATVTTPSGGTLSRNWNFTSSTTADDAPKTYTIEHGSSVRADKYTYGLITEVGMTFNRTAIEVSGSMMGRAITDNIVLTASPTLIELVPIVPTQVSVYVDPSSATLGTTKLTRAISAEFHLGSRFAGVWVLDAANPSFVNHIETEPDLTLNLVAQANSEGMAYLANLRSGDTAFVRIECIGTTIEATIPYTHNIDMAVKVADTGGFQDADGVYAIEWNFVGVNDSTWGKAIDVNMVNKLTTL